jgi:hypothetical protein
MRRRQGSDDESELEWEALLEAVRAYTFLHPFVFDALLSVFALVSCQAA